ncbi:MAG: patatin-like phospholipase family protein [Sedimenticola sp.]|nr:patatin-like phospholipase family protein [Sedimenticola sp.]
MHKKRVNLALQGGGSHGAFTWGVLDYFMEDGRVSVEGISGTSAGAMNAVVLAHGYMDGAADGARDALESFWRTVSQHALMSPIRRTPLDVLTGNWSLDASPAYLMYDVMSRVVSPYEANPLNLNPLKTLLESSVDFEKVRGCDAIKLFVAATNVHSGKIKVFERSELTADMVLASACLPTLYQAVEIEGVPYWDGGFVGNPPLYPLYDDAKSRDIIIVQINPVTRHETPKTARDIHNRINEISFNTSLLRELRSIEFVHRLLKEKRLDANQYADILVHRIEGSDALSDLSPSSKVNAEWSFLTQLKDMGRAAAKKFIDQHYDDLGERSTLNLREEFS